MFEAFILGIVEGLTEFLPISSTGHLIIVSDWLGIEHTANHTAFEVIIQLAAILAVFTNYRSKFTFEHIPLWTKVFISFLPIAAVGFMFHEQIKMMFTVETVAWMFIVGGVILMLTEWIYSESPYRIKNLDDITYKQASVIGIMQMFALVPGTSRAGASIVGGMLFGLDRKTATEWSFLLALPVLAAASGFDLIKHYDSFSTSDIELLIVGFVTSFVVATLIMKLFLLFIERFSFISFGVYRIVFGVVLLWILGT